MKVRRICLAIGFGNLLASPAWGQNPAAVEAGTRVATETKQAAESVISGFRQAVVSGDTETLSVLAGKFLIPAAVALGIFMAGWFLASFVGRVVGSTVSKRVDLTFGKFLGKMLKNGIMVLVLLGILGHFGIDVTSFAAIIAALGFAVGMALQGTLGNFAAGVMLLVFRPFKVGDYIHVGDESGVVEEIDLFATRLNTLDNLHKIVPNGQIFGATITNFSRNKYRRVDVNVGVEYAADVDYTRAVLQTAISEIPGAVDDPAPQVVLRELADSSVNWQLRVWCEPAEYWNVRELLTVAAKKGLDLNGVGIPFPQMQLHLPPRPEQAKRAA
jgi:small conductance mechanosensitive channel